MHGADALQRQKMEERNRKQRHKKFFDKIGLFQDPNLVNHQQR